MRWFPGRCVSLLALIGSAGVVEAQVYSGSLRLRVTDPSGHALEATVTVISDANHLRRELLTDADGRLELKELPFGPYRVTARNGAYLRGAETVNLQSAAPLETSLRLALVPQTASVEVNAAATLVDPHRTTAVMTIGAQGIEDRLSSLPGRSVEDLIATEPGWLYEGNAVLHPRGSEYQTQFVIDGIPLTDNRSPSFGPEIEADDVASLNIYTAGFPAEYGRKMGGVVELDTRKDTSPGLHGQIALSGGSYDSATAYGQAQQRWKSDTLSVAASGSMTDHYLNPVVPQNYTNNGTTADFSARYERDLTRADMVTLNVRHELSRFLIPDELVQEQAGQVENGDNFETLGTAGYRHVLSPDGLVSLAGMVRDKADDLESNTNPTPIAAFQHNRFREGYVKADTSLHKGRQEFKAGLESDNTVLHEAFHYTLTDPTQFDPDTPPSLVFAEQRPDLEQSAFVQDLVRLGDWTISAGLRWDHYQLLLNQEAFSPRISVGRYQRGPDLLLHASYDRVFQTPSADNILLSSSTAIQSLSSQFLRLPVQPSRGHYVEGGLTEGFAGRVRLDANVYRRQVRNYADDDQLLNTGVSYPIAFDHAVIYGAEAKLEAVHLGRFSGSVSYAYMVGAVWYPVTGGLFLGDDAASALVQQSGHFPDSQDQRHTVSGRGRYDIRPRFYVTAGFSFGSGLPFAYTGDRADALAQYGAAVVDRLNFTRGRILPLFAVNAGAGADLYRAAEFKVHLQIDGDDLNHRLNVLDFGGLFSGNAIGPRRSVVARLRFER